MKRINWNLVRRQLAEARQQLDELEQLALKPGKRCEAYLQVGLEHAYHHINFAWNARLMSNAAYRNLTQRQFSSNSKYPAQLQPLGDEDTPPQKASLRRRARK